MTLGTILQDCYRRLGYQSSPDGEVITRLASFADEAQKEIIREPGCESLLRIELTFDSVTDQAEYGLGMGLSQITNVRDVSNRYWLKPMSETDYRRRVVDPSKWTGKPLYYVPLALTSVALRPSAAAEIFIKSTSASDIQTVYWEVLLSTGELRSGKTALTGTTAVSFDTALTTIVQILDVYLSQGANGTVTVHQTSGAGTELARITVDQPRAYRKQLALVPRPTSVITFTVEGERDVTDLINLQDEPILPPRFQPMIGVGVRKREFELRGNQDRWMMADKEWQEWRGSLRRFLDPTQGVIVPGGERTGWSPLGSSYPAEWYR